MEKQMKAERERREQILIAEGEKKSAILRADRIYTEKNLMRISEYNPVHNYLLMELLFFCNLYNRLCKTNGS